MIEKAEISTLISPYGGSLVDLLVKGEELNELKERATRLPSLQLSDRAVCDLELLASGAFSPLDRFMSEEDYQYVLDEMRLKGGYLFPIPVTLPVEHGPMIRLDQDIALCDPKNCLLAVMTVEEIYEWDIAEAAQKICRTQDLRHPLVAEMHRWGKFNISGRVRMIRMPQHHDFTDLRRGPSEVRALLESFGKENVVAFQTRNPLHRAHEELTKRAIRAVDGALLLHPAVGITKPGDVSLYTRVRTYKALTQKYYDHDRVLLSLIPLAMRMSGPREALWHALIRRNYGANNFIIGRNHADPGLDSNGKPFYGPYDAQELVEEYGDELGISVIQFQELVYLPEDDRFEEISRIPAQKLTASISGTQLRDNYLSVGKRLPDWFTRPETADILAEAYPPRDRQGVCIWFTGLSGAGKSTTAEVLAALLQEHGRRITILDGDVVRMNLSKGLGFGKADRDTNIRRIGFVASEIVRHGGVVIVAAVSPYRETRDEVRGLVPAGSFIEVFVDTPLEVCEQRDVKGMYAKARRAEIQGFTGIDDPYEPPLAAEVTLTTINYTPAENARRILDLLLERGLIRVGSVA